MRTFRTIHNSRSILKTAVAILLSTTALGATAAWAGPYDYQSCNTSNICMWQDADWVGARLFVGNSPGKKNFTGSVGFNDMASSWANRSTMYDARWYYDVYQAGDNRCMDADTRLAWIGWIDNEEASSSRIFETNTACS